jgi:hypothetical protein
VRYCLIAANGAPVEISELLEYCYPRAQTHPHWHRTDVHCALPRYAVLVGRDAKRRGRPGLWAPNEQLRRLIDGTRDTDTRGRNSQPAD